MLRSMLTVAVVAVLATAAASTQVFAADNGDNGAPNPVKTAVVKTVGKVLANKDTLVVFDARALGSSEDAWEA